MRITDIPISDKLRDLRQGHLNGLIRVSGVVTKRSTVFPQLKAVCYNCQSCGLLVGPFRTLEGGFENRPGMCPGCQTAGGQAFKINHAKSEYDNYQTITLQESPGSVPPGRVPRYKDVVLLGDLIDVVRPGEEVEITGIYMHRCQRVSNDKTGFPVFSTQIEANCVQKKNSTENSVSSELWLFQYAPLVFRNLPLYLFSSLIDRVSQMKTKFAYAS